MYKIKMASAIKTHLNQGVELFITYKDDLQSSIMQDHSYVNIKQMLSDITLFTISARAQERNTTKG